MSDRLRTTLAAIDAANGNDPNQLVVRGVPRPKALGEAELATEWVLQLRPDAGPELLIAVRAHHVRRWTVPRSSYPDGRAGYLRWRRDLHDVHAQEAGAVMTADGWSAAEISRVQDIIGKRGLGHNDDADVQAFEDALCLVFIETQYDELAGRLTGEKMRAVVDKTLKKMSPQAQALAATLR